MARIPVPTDLSLLKPIVEAMIFASEEPLAPRTLLRLLFEEENKPAKKKGMADEQTLFDQTGEEPEDEGTVEMEEYQEEIAEEEPLTESLTEEGEEESLSSRREEPTGNIGQKELRKIIAELNDEYEEGGRAFRIMEIAGGFQFATTKGYGEFVGLLSKERSRRRLSPAALETLAIVAYRQPVTKPEVEAIRGVNCDQVLLSLLERNLITISGRSEAVGKPLLYGTTEDFLRAFGLNSLSDLPKLRELEELMEDDAYSATRPEGISEEVTQELLELDGEEDERPDTTETSDELSRGEETETANTSEELPSDFGTEEETEGEEVGIPPVTELSPENLSEEERGENPEQEESAEEEDQLEDSEDIVNAQITEG